MFVRLNGSARAANSLSSSSVPPSRQPWPRIVLQNVCSSATSSFASRNSCASFPHAQFPNGEIRAFNL
jgi:hypothetical protein